MRIRHLISGLLAFCLSLGLCVSASATTTIRILTSYDSNVLAIFGGNIGSVIAEVNQQIVNLNTAFANSGIDAVAQSAGVVPFSDAGATSIFNMAAVGQQNLSLRVKRDLAGADVVMMLGFFGSPSGRALQIGSTANTAFAAVDIAAFSINGYQHEFAHLLGALHQFSGGQQNNDSTKGPAHGAYIRVVAGDPGAGAGAVGSAVTPLCLQTIMAYAPEANLAGVSCTSNPILWYSTPNSGKQYFDGVWTVFAGSSAYGGDFHNTTFGGYNNASQINSYVPIVGAYHNTKLASGVARVLGFITTYLLMSDP